MSRMPGRGWGVVIGSTLQRYRVAAQREQPLQFAPELGAKTVEPRVGNRHKAVDFDQIERAAQMLAGSKEGAAQPDGREDPEDPPAADLGCGFGGEQGAVPAGLLRCGAADRERVGAVVAGVAARPE